LVANIKTIRDPQGFEFLEGMNEYVNITNALATHLPCIFLGRKKVIGSFNHHPGRLSIVN